MERSAWPLCGVLLATALFAREARAQYENEDPACPGAMSAEGADLVFEDGFKVGTPCQWSDAEGWTGVCGGVCGNCDTEEGEACDDGNQVTETQCPYGTIFCTFCNDTCTAEIQLQGPFCGDGNVSEAEKCDDGNMVTETECPYGTAPCTICMADCTQGKEFSGGVCGDGDVDPPYEECDDGNTSACGTCSADCGSPQGESATGMLALPGGSGIFDGDTFTLDDGLGVVEIFEFDRQGNGVTPGHVPVFVPGVVTESQVRNACVNAINDVPDLSIDAIGTGGQILHLVHHRETSLGNVPILESVFGENFTIVFGMDGGQAGDCGLGVGCVSGDDCASDFCTFGNCESP